MRKFLITAALIAATATPAHAGPVHPAHEAVILCLHDAAKDIYDTSGRFDSNSRDQFVDRFVFKCEYEIRNYASIVGYDDVTPDVDAALILYSRNPAASLARFLYQR